MFRRLLSLAALAAFAIVVTSGCDPRPGYHQIAGDSVTFLASFHGSNDVFDHAHTDGTVGIGWELSDALPAIQDRVNDPNRSPSVLVLAFGQNEADGGVWDQGEQNTWLQGTYTADDDACVVWVLPHYAGTNLGHKQAIQAMRHGIDVLVDSRNADGMRTLMVDWRPIVQAHPNYLESDGVHPTPNGAQAYANLIGSGVHSC